MLLKTQILAGALIEYVEVGDFFRLMQSDAPVDVFFYFRGHEVARAEGVAEGYSESFNASTFDRIAIRSSIAQTIQFVSRYGNTVTYDQPPTGSVHIENNRGEFSHVAVAAGVASAVLLPARPQRQYLLIQNQDAANAVYVRFDGAAATVAAGLKIAPGGVFVAESFAPVGAVTAIAAAGTTALHIVEG